MSNLELKRLSILGVGAVSAYGGNNTTVHRFSALSSICRHLEVLDSNPKGEALLRTLKSRFSARLFRIGIPCPLPDISRLSQRLLARFEARHWDVLWLDKSLTVSPEVLRKIRLMDRPPKIIGFSPDDMFARHCQSQQFLQSLPLYDCYITTKSYNQKELLSLGCPKVIFAPNGYDPAVFRPMEILPADIERFGGDVGFIGTYESERAEWMHMLAENGVSVRIWGNGWKRNRLSHPNLKIEGRPLYGSDFAKACISFKINLGFLRKMNRDQQTTRSVEIPACGAFMLAERTAEHLGLFNEGEEAAFFESKDELLEKVRFYLANDRKREDIARAGRCRCISSGYDNRKRLQDALSKALQVEGEI